MTPAEAFAAIRDIAQGQLGPITGLPPVVTPPPVSYSFLIGPPDALGCVGLQQWEDFLADKPASLPIHQLPGEPPIAPAVAPRKFHLLDALSLIQNAELREKVQMSAAGGELRQNRAMTFKAAPWWKPSLRWVEDEVIAGALASNRPHAEVTRKLIGRYRRIERHENGMTHFLWLNDQDYAAGAP